MGSDLHVVDYIVFGASIVVSVGIGVWYARPSAGKQTTETYLQGDRQLKLVPVIISLCVTYVSAIMMIGVGAEIYYFGVEMMFFIISKILGYIVTVLTWVPLLYPLKLTSANQYLRMRYRSHVASLVGMVLQLLSVIMVCGIVLYAPSTLFESFGGFPTWASLLIVGISSTLYTSIGGMKGVIVTDMFQAAIMFVGLLTVTIQGFIAVGGWSNAWRIYNDWGRIKLDKFMVPNPFKRLDFWSVVPFQTVMWANVYGLMQASVQRYTSVPTQKMAIKCVLGVIPGSVTFLILSCLCGLVMFAYYAIKGCDPLVSGQIKDVNQLLLYLVMEILYYPGVPGFFIAAIFCSSLSTLSSQLTAMAAFTWDDLLRIKYGHWSDQSKTRLLKALVCAFGIFSTCVGFMCIAIQGTLIKLVIMFTQAMFVPLGILFIAGAALPKINLKGALTSCSVASCLILWMIVGGELYGGKDQRLKVPTSNCPTESPANVNETLTTVFPEVTSGVEDQSPENEAFFMNRISHYWYGPLGFMTGCICAIVLSFVPYFQESELIPENLVFPFVRRIFRTKRVPEDIDEKLNRTQNNKWPNDEQRNVKQREAFLKTEMWHQNSPGKDIEEIQNVYCL